MPKNILVVDGADNCAYDIFQVDDADFRSIFPAEGQDIEFIEDVLARGDADALDEVFRRMWSRPVRKDRAMGIHGTLFYELAHKKAFYPNKRDDDLDGVGRAFRSRDL